MVMPFNSVPRARSISRRAQFDRSTRAREVLNVDGLQVNVLRKKNRNMYLRVKPPYGAIEVTAPVRMPQHTIVEFVRERRSWVDEALHKMAQARSRTFASPDLDPDVGGSRTTVLRDARDPGSPRMETPHETSSFTWNEEYVERARRSIEQQLPDLLSKWTPIVGKSPTKITLRTMTSRWGSCTPKRGGSGSTYNSDSWIRSFLSMYSCMNSLICGRAGTGRTFQERMSLVLPNWKELRRELNRCTIFDVPQSRG